jgi:hypothetical protein
MSTDLQPTPSARNAVFIAVFALAVLHHDFWWWDDRTAVFGFMPIGLFYHTCFSVAAGCLWWLASKFAWPAHIEAWADEFDGQEADRGEREGGAH